MGTNKEEGRDVTGPVLAEVLFHRRCENGEILNQSYTSAAKSLCYASIPGLKKG
jgi:hypothetical protein